MNIVFPYWLIVTVSNIAILLVLYMSLKKPKIAKAILFAIFVWAGFTNFMITILPHILPVFANITYSVFDRLPLHHWFIVHSNEVIRTIAIVQWFIALTLMIPGRISRIGALLGMIMLVVIAPIGFGNPFPFTLFAALAMYFLSSKRNLEVEKSEEKPIENFNNSDND